MDSEQDKPVVEDLRASAGEVRTLQELAGLLRRLRRRHARRNRAPELTYRELAAATGWSLAAVAEYLAGRTLPPVDRFDDLVRLLGASADEHGALATARDRVEEAHRSQGTVGDRPDQAELVVPRQLPAALPTFVGRIRELDALGGLLDETAATVVITALGGTAGVGKTALALHWAHQVADRFPDGQLYVNLRGFHPTGSPADPADVLRDFVAAFQVPLPGDSPNLAELSALYRGVLADKRVLVLLDNARNSEQVRPLLPGTPGALAVVTSRNPLTGLIAVNGARPLIVDLLDPAEARELLAGRLGPDRVAAEPGAVAEIVDRCARLPIALAVVAARAATHPRFPLAVVAHELRDIRDRLRALTGDDPNSDIHAVFAWSYNTLTPPAARLFRLLGLHPGPDCSTAAAASLADLPEPRTRALLAELCRAGLIVEQTPGRHSCHDLLRRYAEEQAEQQDSAEQRTAAINRMLDHYLRTARAAAELLHPDLDPLELPPPAPGAKPHRFAAAEQAMTWLIAERAALVAALDLATRAGLNTHAWQLALDVGNFLDRQTHWPELVETKHAILETAQRHGDWPTVARMHRCLAFAYTQLDRIDDATAHLEHALGAYHTLDDHAELVRTYRNFATLAKQPGATPGTLEATLSRWEHALPTLRELGDRAAESATWHSLGLAHYHLGDTAKAITSYREALRISTETGPNTAAILSDLGDALTDNGDPDAARNAWQQALTLLDNPDHPDAEQIRTKLEQL